MDYCVSFLIISGSLPPCCHLASYDRKGPPHYFNETGEPFDLFFEVDKDLFVGTFFGLERMEELLEMLDG
jgi:hypothetical protein